jgi:hypothetical protein
MEHYTRSWEPGLGIACRKAAAFAPWRDGTTYLVMSPLESMQRLVALFQARTDQAELVRAMPCANRCCAATNSAH